MRLKDSSSHTVTSRTASEELHSVWLLHLCTESGNEEQPTFVAPSQTLATGTFPSNRLFSASSNPLSSFFTWGAKEGGRRS